VQANVLKFGRVGPFGNGIDDEREADFGSEKYRSNLVAHRLDPWEPLGKQFDLRWLVPVVKYEVGARGCGLACGGPDTLSNLQWQMIRAAGAKDRWGIGGPMAANPTRQSELTP
jgi:hypothetical protein